MDFFTCKVRLSGSILNEVPKIGVSAAEVVMLRHLHGGDAVVGLKRTHKRNVEQAEMREDLELRYGPEKVIKVFGQAHNVIPTQLADYSENKPLTVENIAGAEKEDATALMA